jgi:hypothetical protein
LIISGNETIKVEDIKRKSLNEILKIVSDNLTLEENAQLG